MGKTRESQQSTQTQSTQYTPTAEETAFNKLQLAQAQEFDPIQRELNRRGGNIINQLLSGEYNLPGFLSRLPRGIDEEVTSGIVNQSLRDINAQLRASGVGSMLESGVAQSIGARTAGDIRRAAEETNLGNIFNLLNLGVGGQAQVQQPILSTSGMLSQRLAGLRGVTQTGTMNTMTRAGTNFFSSPVVAGLATGLGTALGGPLGGAAAGAFAGLFGGRKKD